MINPIALVMIVLGFGLLLTGTLLIRKRRKIAGLLFVLVGLAAAALPFLTG